MARPHQPILSRALIVRTALELTDRHGRFTLPELARRLGVSVSSIYHHVPGRDAIVEGIREVMVGAIAVPSADEPWTAAVTRWARDYREAFAAHPAAIPMVVSQTVVDPHALAGYEGLAERLGHAGLPGDQIIVVITMLDTLCLGAALDLAAPSTIWATDSPDSALSRALADLPTDRDRTREAFETQLGLIMAFVARQAELNPVPADPG